MNLETLAQKNPFLMLAIGEFNTNTKKMVQPKQHQFRRQYY